MSRARRLPCRLLLVCALLWLPGIASAADCPPAGWSADRLQALKASGFELPEADARQALALGLLDCLGAPDPALRDGIAFEALSRWLRAKQLDVATRTRLLERLLPELEVTDADGFRAPFAALVLSEVARTDRIEPWLGPAQRAQLVSASARFLSGVRDYRGFDAREGWRHGVAHGADLAMQLALNPALDAAQLEALLAAVGSQVAPVGEHAYVYGEPERLVRPVLFIAQRGAIDEARWREWFERLVAPAPLPSWEAAFSSQAGLARRHNLHAFLFALYANTRDSEQPGQQALAKLGREALQKLP